MSVAQQAVERRTRTREARKPDFVVRAPDPQRRGRWITLGAAWKREGDDGVNIKLNSIPVGGVWDGTLICLPPLPDDGDPPDGPSEE